MIDLQETVASFRALERKIKILLADKDSLEKEMIHLKSENESLRQSVSKKTQLLDDFQNRDKIAKIADNITLSTVDTDTLKVTLDDYIKKIDQCIVYLGE